MNLLSAESYFYDLALARFDTNGQPDLSFGTNGVATIQILNMSKATTMKSKCSMTENYSYWSTAKVFLPENSRWYDSMPTVRAIPLLVPTPTQY
jgi:hypothetical protein